MKNQQSDVIAVMDGGGEGEKCNEKSDVPAVILLGGVGNK